MKPDARKFAHDAHDSIGQKRKYTGEPYWVHTDAVAEIVSEFTDDQAMIATAHLHDIVEDVNIDPYTLATITSVFGNDVGRMVADLTDVYTKEAFPDLNRAKRKALEAERLGGTDSRVQTIKYADLLDNGKSIIPIASPFSKVFIKEALHLMDLMQRGDPVLRMRTYDLL